MKTPTQTEKRTVLKGIVAAWISSGVFVFGGYHVLRSLGFFGALTAPRACAFALLLGAASLAMGIGWAARTRHFASNIDGSEPEAGTSLDITLRYVTNTAEQFLLFAAACLALIFAAPELARGLLPVMGLWFFIARMLFWAGYRQHPLRRAMGFAATFHPTLVLLTLAVIKLLTE